MPIGMPKEKGIRKQGQKQLINNLQPKQNRRRRKRIRRIANNKKL